MSETVSKQNSSEGQLNNGDLVKDFEQFHGKLTSKLNDLQTSVEKAADSYEMKVEYSPTNGSTYLPVSIRSDECYRKAGELGCERFHLLLGPQGGLLIADQSNEITLNRTDFLDTYDTKTRAWKAINRNIERAR